MSELTLKASRETPEIYKIEHAIQKTLQPLSWFSLPSVFKSDFLANESEVLLMRFK
jgi:hypothetical protein